MTSSFSFLYLYTTFSLNSYTIKTKFKITEAEQKSVHVSNASILFFLNSSLLPWTFQSSQNPLQNTMTIVREANHCSTFHIFVHHVAKWIIRVHHRTIQNHIWTTKQIQGQFLPSPYQTTEPSPHQLVRGPDLPSP